MNNIYFPNETNKLNHVIAIYESEISTRNEWIEENVDRLNESMEHSSASIIISYAISIVNHAMLVLRLVDKSATGARKENNKKEKAIERAKILHEKHPNLPNPPGKLRLIRNDYEHFESRLDEWATSANPSYYIDLNVGGGIKVTGSKRKDEFRSLVGFNLMFWNNSLDLQEVVEWINQMNVVITEKIKHSSNCYR